MSDRTHSFFLKDMHASAEKVVTLTRGKTKEEFLSDWILVEMRSYGTLK